MKIDCSESIGINKYFSNIFYKLGGNISRHPWAFFIIPALFSICISVGISKLSVDRDVLNSIFPDKGRVFVIKNFMQKVWNSSHNSDEVRFSQFPNSVAIYFLKKGSGNILEKKPLLEIGMADKIIKNITIKAGNKTIGYTDICAIMQQRCFKNPIMDVIENVDDLLANKYKFKYPVDINNLSYSYRPFVFNLGGVITDENDFVKEAKVVMLNYLFDESDSFKKQYINEWSDKAYEAIQNQLFQFVRSVPHNLRFVETYAKDINKKIQYMLPPLIVFVCTFSILTNISTNLVKSKPWLGIAAVVSAGLAIVSSFGLMGICEVKNSYGNIAIPFLVFVTEVDDAYVLIACWKITNLEDEVEKRMAETYYSAGTSIAITSVTNVFSYCIGMTSSFPIVRIFCYYSATCIFFTFFFQITFFGACMALDGYRERRRRHPFIFCSVSYEKYPENSQSVHEECTMIFFRDKLGKILTNSVMKAIILFLYFLNLGFGIYGVFCLRQGLRMQNFYPDKSIISESVRIYYKYFTEYSYPVHIIINKTLDYSDIGVQKSVEEIIQKFESHPHVAESRFTVSWLKYYKEFQRHPVAKFSLNGFNMSNKNDFVHGFRNVFLKFKAAEQFSKDVVFSDDGSDIICSRFLVVTKGISNRKLEVETLKEFWKIAEESPFPVLIHTVFSDIIEQGIFLINLVYQLFWTTSILILIIFFSIIPNLYCALAVAISLISTIIETIGYMSLWDINLDIFSVLSLILCIGYCVNYPSHISYAFVVSSYKAPDKKLKDSLYRIGFPIFQGSLSTILGILFAIRNMYFILLYVKIVILITLFTAFHALFFIPVLLSLIYRYAHLQK